MPTFSALVAQGTALTPLPRSAAMPAGRFQGDPVRWTGVPAGAVVKALASGCVTAVASGPPPGLPGNDAAAWTLFELSPLPQMAPAAFRALGGGLPVLLVAVAGAGAAGPAQDDFLAGGAPFVTAPAGTGATAFFAVAFQDRVCRDPLTWAEAIAAIPAGGAIDAAWTPFAADLAALPGARKLYLLDHLGRPLTAGSAAISVDGGAAVTVSFTGSSDGDTNLIVGAGSRATVSSLSAGAPIIAAAAIAVGGDGGAFQAPFQLAPGARLAQVTDAALWLAPPDAGLTGLPRWNPGSFLEPIADGNPYFARLVTDLRSAKGGGAAGLAGWAFVKGSLADSTLEWPLVPGADDTRLLALVRELRGGGADVKFLVNQFLRFDSDRLDDFPELAPILLAIYLSLFPLNNLGLMLSDPAGFYVGGGLVLAVQALLTFTSVPIDAIKSLVELSTDFVTALDDFEPGLATWTPYPAAFADNPQVPQPLTLLGHVLDDIHHLGVYHQKMAAIRTAGGDFITYLGGIDLNSDRVDDPLHRAIFPFHDVQVRITGPAARDVLQTFADRATFHDTTTPVPPPPAIAETGSHLVQIARTYFVPAAGSGTGAFPFAPNGESTTVRSILQAIAAARDSIYIEDQYFTPPDDYVRALLDAAAPERGVRALVIVLPYQTDQPYGGIRRADVLNALGAAWGSRLRVGAPLRRFLDPTPGLTSNLGRLRLTADLAAGGTEATFGPEAHLPEPPFWCFVGNELVLVDSKVGAPGGSTDVPPVRQQTVTLMRAGGVDPRWGATPVAHAQGTPVLCVRVPGIYVHAKVMIVDDVFLFAGSSNVNRRSLYHDGELNSFTVPQHLRGDPANPARILRCRLWAEHLGLPPEMGLPLFSDPQSALSYFAARSWYQGAHVQPLTFFGPTPPDLKLGVSDSAFGTFVAVLVPTLEEEAKPETWRSLVDPTTNLEPAPRRDGPEYS